MGKQVRNHDDGDDDNLEFEDNTAAHTQTRASILQREIDEKVKTDKLKDSASIRQAAVGPSSEASPALPELDLN